MKEIKDLPNLITLSEALEAVRGIPFNAKIETVSDIQEWLMDEDYAYNTNDGWKEGEDSDGYVAIRTTTWFDYRLEEKSNVVSEVLLTADGFRELLSYIMKYKKYNVADFNDDED